MTDISDADMKDLPEEIPLPLIIGTEVTGMAYLASDLASQAPPQHSAVIWGYKCRSPVLFSCNVFTVIVKVPVSLVFSHQLEVSMDHHEQVSINASPYRLFFSSD